MRSITLRPCLPTNNDSATRTFIGDEGTAMNPWRAPGSAPVLGSGCGVAGGADVPMPNGGTAPEHYPQGMDGKDLPETKPTLWQIGSTAEVAFAFFANHGGGYQYRLCRKGNISEECFQNNPLPFHGKQSWIQYADWAEGKHGRKVIDRILAHPDDVIPKKSQWARNPIPSCFVCNQDHCGRSRPNLTERVTRVRYSSDPSLNGTRVFMDPPQYGGDVWFKEEICRMSCAETPDKHGLGACDEVQFPSPADDLSGYDFNGHNAFPYSIVDNVEIPSALEPGEYLLSWRWDCEQSSQIWQNCADISLQLAEIQV